MQEYHREHPNSIGLYISMTYEKHYKNYSGTISKK